MRIICPVFICADIALGNIISNDNITIGIMGNLRIDGLFYVYKTNLIIIFRLRCCSNTK